jgi:hypothetical protein
VNVVITIATLETAAVPLIAWVTHLVSKRVTSFLRQDIKKVVKEMMDEHVRIEHRTGNNYRRR